MEEKDSVEKQAYLPHLIDAMSEEIRAYRQRQLTTFREVVIVLAVIIWGAGQLLSPDNALMEAFVVRVLAAVACASAGYFGWQIIHNYKRRIYYVRDRRNEVAQCFKNLLYDEAFYPTIPDDVKNKDHQTRPSSQTYGRSLAWLTALTFLVNLVLALGLGWRIWLH